MEATTIPTKVTSRQAYQVALEAKHKACDNEESIKDVKQWVNGNGTPGAKVRFERIENKMENLSDDVGEIKGDMKWATRLIIGTLFTSVAGIVISLIKLLGV